jgi:uncharacterized protein (DUF58 family)
MTFTRRVSVDEELEVHPNLAAVSRSAIQLFSTRSLQFGARVERFRGDGTEFDHLREYVPGFDIRTVDWKASARHGKLFCREFRAERNRQIVIAVDSGRLMSEPLMDAPRVDHAIQAGLTLAYVSLHVGDWVGLVSFDDKLRHYCAPVKGPGAFGRLGQVASRIDYSSRETNFTLSLMQLMQQQTRRALVVVMTDFVDTITAELMVENLARIAQRHLVLFLALKDVMLEQVSAADPEHLLDLHRSVVAFQLLKDREMVIRRLERLGIHCIDARPDEVSSRLIDHYLQLKRKEAF